MLSLIKKKSNRFLTSIVLKAKHILNTLNLLMKILMVDSKTRGVVFYYLTKSDGSSDNFYSI